ncbi:MAG: hypothetical protein O8C66_03850 [Candidatus Methanoperedens sp.]|nr:hypothetical protein [Candidatus Methanoperedens sp.]MCZ7369620.1 hypothetical protein [Candidatus Methanoperedens sp.]
MKSEMAMTKSAYRVLILGIILSLIYSRAFSFTLIPVFEGFVLAIFLAWFISKVDLKPRSAFILIWFSLFMIGFFNNLLEAYFFTKVYQSESLIMAILISLFISLLESASAIFLLRPEGSNDITAALKSHIRSRTASSWVKRIIAASAVYFLIYFIFGLMVSPFVMPYYSQPSSGLVIPSITLMIPLELLRGFIYAVVLLVVFAGIKTEQRLNFAVASALLYIPGAFLPLISSMMSLSFISAVAPYHMVEILADSVVYGYAASRLIGAKS